MTKPTQLMPELLILRDMASKPRCPYCHAPEGEPHACNCWAPGSIFERRPGTDICDSCGIDRAEVERLTNTLASERQLFDARFGRITVLRDRITELEGALEKIVKGSTSYASSWQRNLARAALKGEPQ